MVAQVLERTDRHLVTGGDPDEPAVVPIAALFGDDDYLEASTVAKIGAALIQAYPEELGHLTTADIAYVWKAKGTKKCGVPVLGTCQRPGGLTRHFAAVDFVVTIMADHCREMQMTRWQLEALTFHELLHADVDGDTGKPAVKGHDTEMFFDEIKHYGLWKSDLREARVAFEQVPLPIGAGWR